MNRRAERRMLSAAQNGTAKVIADAGHACNLEQPQRFNAAVREFARVVGLSPRARGDCAAG